MAYQETTTKSYGSRLGGGLRGIGGGIVAIIIGSVLLWWNEGRAVKTAKMLEEAQDAAIHVEDVTRIDPALDGKLIHACAITATQDSLSDPMFNVGAVAIRLDRKVEFYQWVEESKQTKKDKIGGGEETITTYTYKKAWAAKPINSQEFKDSLYRDRNKVLMALDAKEQVAENVTFGAYRLPSRLISSISGTRPVELSLPNEQLREINKVAIRAAGDTVQYADSVFKYVHISENQLYIGRSEGAPEIGDVRVTFSVVLPGEASIIAQVQGDTFVNYTAKNGKTLSTLSMGTKSMDEMFESQKASNSTWTWILRILGALIVIGGFKSIFSLLYLLFKVLPFLADIVEAGVGLVAGILGIVWSLIIIAIAWLVFRPVLAIIILIIAAAGVFFLIKKGKGKKAVAIVVAGMLICGNAKATYPISQIIVKGDINLNLDNRDLFNTEASVSFPRFPADIDEFQQVREVLKQTPQGAVALQLMAMELYSRSASEGEKAFAMCNISSNIKSITSRCHDLFQQTIDQRSIRPYQVAAFLQGATPENGYNPSEPYTVCMKVSVNGATYSNDFQAKVLHWVIYTSASDSGSRLGPDVIFTHKPGEPNDGWVVFNSPALVSRAREISFSAKFDGLK